jgi:hypothetical protein
MTNDVKVHNATAFFKNGETARGLLRLEVSGNGFRDEAVVRFLPEASAGFDGNYDAYKLYGSVPEAAQLYTMGGDELSINALPETGSVAAGVRAGTGGPYTLAATEINDMPNVTLEDTKTGIFTELAKKSYTFQLEAGETGERFILHFSALGTGENPGGPVSIYGFGSTLYVNLNAVSAEAVYVYNMAGQLVARQNKVTGLGRIALPAPGAYTVKVLTPGESTVKKVVIY